MVSLFRRQLYYMLYKNFIFKLRNRRQTIGEIVVVLYFVMILAIIKTTSKQDTMAAIPDSATKPYDMKSSDIPKIGYVIKGTSSLMDDLVKKIASVTNGTMHKFDTESKMDDYYQENEKGFSIGFILEYNSTSNSLSYTIKTPKTKIADPNNKVTEPSSCRKPGVRNLNGGPFSCPADTYVATGFTALQSMLDLKFIQLVTNQTASLKLDSSVRMFPKRIYTPPTEYLKNVVSIYMNIAFAPYILFLLTNIVTEKEKKIKEAMKIMGLNMTAYWLSWFITYGIIILIGCIITTAIATSVKLFGTSNFFIIFLLLFLYGLSIITLSFMLTTLFKKAKTAGMFGALGTIILSTLSLIHIYANTTNAVKWLTCLLSPVALSLGLTAGLDSKNPLTFSNITSLGEFPPINVIIMLLVDTLLYLLLAIYLDALFPGEYGKARHPLFLFSPSFWRNLFGMNTKESVDIRRRTSLKRSQSVRSDQADPDNIENIPEELLGAKVISIQNLCKTFKQGKKKADLKALDGVTLDVYEGQITALLGHNGAGKSTLISTLTGMLTPSHGSAELYGLDIRKSDDMDDLRQIIGLCPQQNIIFEQLNSREHLTFFAGIKGLSPEEMKDTVEKLLREIDLADHATTLAGSLSGGQKRKLCVGIALIGNPKVVFLDEPTSGMDPSSRRHIWSLLQSKRENRVIFLTTHFMDEADILADYKAIMSKGRIRCAGSSLFLKNKYGIGYHLGMVIDKDTADVEAIQNSVMQYVPGAEVSRLHGKELAFRLPLSKLDKFPDLFKYFEESTKADEIFSVPELGIISYGVSMTTLEEVFLKLEEVVEEEEKENDEEAQKQNIQTSERTHLTVTDNLTDTGSYGNLCSSTLELNPVEMESNQQRKVSPWMQLMALLEVRFWGSVRNPMKIFFQAVLPAILLIIGLVLFRNLAAGKSDVADKVNLQPSLYLSQGSDPKESSQIIWTTDKAFYPNRSDLENAFDAIKLKSKFLASYNLFDFDKLVIAYNVSNFDKNGQIGYVVRYNDTQIHSIPVGINAINNAMYHLMTTKKGTPLPATLPITVYSKPFKPRTPEWTFDALGQVAVMLIGLSFISMSGGFVVEPVMARQLGIRHQLRVSGTSRVMYWFSFLSGDLMFYIIPIIILFIVIAALDILAFNMSAAMGALFLLLIMYIPSSLLFTYTLSFMFSKWETSQNVVPTLVNFAALIPYFVVSSIDMASGSLEDKPLHATIASIFVAIDPPFTLLAGLYYIARVYRVESIIQQKSKVDIPASKYFDWYSNNALPATYICTFLHILIFGWAVFAIDCYAAGGNLIFPLSLFKNIKCKFGKKKAVAQSSIRCTADVNQDVKLEKEKVIDCILQDQVNSKSVLVQGLCKQFKEKKVVRDINMMVNRGEIFGILGPNGAGKTTTLNMVTADLHPDKGQIFVDGHNIETDLQSAFQSLGYCPQIDALWEIITVRQHLKCYGLIKGVPADKINNLINHYAQALKVTEHLDKRSKDISGGTKRKLSFLISMIGDANVVIMDEPSTGLDPGARRFLWTAISSNIIGERGVILTTHSMEEADALCARVGIVVKGELKCVGTTQELKTTYGGGYQLEIKFKTKESEKHDERKQIVSDYVLSMFPRAVELEYFGSRITFKIPIEEVKNLSIVFASLEAGKTDIGIEEYSFSQSSLEQVFLEFAKEQDSDLTGVSPDQSVDV